VDRESPTLGPRLPALEDAGPHVRLRIGHDQVLGGQVVVCSQRWRRALEDAGDIARGRLRHEPQESRGFLDPLALDAPRSRGGPFREEPFRYLAVAENAHVLGSYFEGRSTRSVCFPCPRKVRVGENSPRRWPTMFSVT